MDDIIADQKQIEGTNIMLNKVYGLAVYIPLAEVERMKTMVKEAEANLKSEVHIDIGGREIDMSFEEFEKRIFSQVLITEL